MFDAPQNDRGFMPVNGAQLYYAVEGHGPPLVFLHDGIADLGMWDPQVAEFAPDYRTIRYDLRGAGQSLLPEGPYVPAEDLAVLLDRLRVTQATLVGAGLGGRIAVDFALAYPERVTGLALEGPIVSGYVWSDAMAPYLVALDAALAAGNVGQAVEVDLRQWLDGPGRTPEDVDPAVRDRVREMAAQSYAASDGEGTPEPGGPPALPRLTEIRAPLLVVVGAYEAPDLRRIADRLEVLVAGAGLAVLPGAGHLANLEQPAAFNAALHAFLATL